MDSYKITGKSSLYDVWGDFIVYRNLVPADARLPVFAELRKRLNLRVEGLPRKSDLDYGAVVAEVLRQARRLDLPSASIKRLVFLGDTRLLDGTAFQNLCQAGGWPGWAFIGRDELASPKQVEIEDQLFIANRWSALPEFFGFLEHRGFGLDEQTALVIDMDKTAVGGRGRNDKVIDEARLEGVKRTVAVLLGNEFDETAFRQVYQELNKPAYHFFTADNQDYLAYICLMLGTDLFDFNTILQEIQAGMMKTFADFIQRVQERRGELSSEGLVAIHEDVWRCFQLNDPTPFKAFRYNEYVATAACFGGEIDEPVQNALLRWVGITAEVQGTAEELRRRGALVFGLSDKPDEASLPNADQAERGMKALHRLVTLCIGEA
jgi:hypothetical protein